MAHDYKKRDLLDWAHFNRSILAQHHLYATGTTGRLVETELALPVTRFRSGPLGGDHHRSRPFPLAAVGGQDTPDLAATGPQAGNGDGTAGTPDDMFNADAIGELAGSAESATAAAPF